MSEPLELWKVLVSECEALGQPLSPATIQAFEAEFAAVAKDGPEAVAAVRSSVLRRIYDFIHSLPQPRAALCLSGGGIRSATFALGVLQGLAELELLERFDYLSTVSGGGYIGSWLSAWVQREPQGIAAVAGELRSRGRDPLRPEPAPLARLRDYTKYLSPRTGVFSADTWTLAAIYIRNLLLNWLVLLPMIVAVICIPRIWPPLLQIELTEPACWWLLAVGLLMQFIGMLFVVWNRVVTNRRILNTQTGFLCLALVEFIAAGVLITLAWNGFQNCRGFTLDSHLFRIFIGLAAMVGLAASLPTSVGGWVSGSCSAGRAILEVVVELLASAAGGALVWCFASIPLLSPTDHPLLYASFAVPAYLGAFLLGAVVLRGLSSYFTKDDDREWSARAAAWVLIVICFWAAGAGIIIFLPHLFTVHYSVPTLLGLIGSASGLSTVLLGKSANTPANPEQATEMINRLGKSVKIRQWALTLAAPIFIICLCAALSLAVSAIVYWKWSAFGGSGAIPGAYWHLFVVQSSNAWLMPIVCVVLILFSLLCSLFVNVNKFSLHAVYRNRLVRAYLGASDEKRELNKAYDAFSGFSGKDNLRMRQLAARPFHIINIALNLTAGKRLAWQERKAESFTVSCLHSGSSELGYRSSNEYGGGQRFGFRTPDRAISLGTALAISGAAANPNMGYHSSAPIAFIMSLFNVRLGAWLGNPGVAGARTWSLSGPRFATRPLVQEALGLTDDQNPYVNLSDGGHFENLGIYEMVRRRSRMIVVCDAGHDPSCGFEDLGNAIRKIYIDMGVRISFDSEVLIRPRQTDPQSTSPQAVAKYCALGTIHYDEVDYQEPGAVAARPGCLLYLKPAFYRGVPLDVYSYGQQYSDFPHQSTADQFFTESQFESYRALGDYVIDEIVKVSGVRPHTLEGLFHAAKMYIAKDAPTSDSPRGRRKG